MDDSDDMKLRDKFAIEILNAYMISKGNDTAIVKFIANYDTMKSDAAVLESIEERFKAIYKVADIMRKSRLATFT